mmetsp:Transcript_22953/g.50568  ORF Transcript_22953/g.50568 Transcript_22953/m.50568 type:complete len:231 (+) Transcript_22953:202-894(+)
MVEHHHRNNSSSLAETLRKQQEISDDRPLLWPAAAQPLAEHRTSSVAGTLWDHGLMVVCAVAVAIVETLLLQSGQALLKHLECALKLVSPIFRLPQLPLQPSCLFDQDVCGWQVAFCHGEPPDRTSRGTSRTCVLCFVRGSIAICAFHTGGFTAAGIAAAGIAACAAAVAAAAVGRRACQAACRGSLWRCIRVHEGAKAARAWANLRNALDPDESDLVLLHGRPVLLLFA